MKIIALAYNYKGYDHEPMIFLKQGLLGDFGTILIPSNGRTWAEAELGFIVGDYSIVGYVLANDITAQIGDRDCHLAQSKARRTFCPIKPISIASPDNIVLRTYVNDELVQHGNTRDRVLNDWGCMQLVASCMDLEPGDIILTGTPPHRGKTTIRAGDRVTVAADRFFLTNEVKLA